MIGFNQIPFEELAFSPNKEPLERLCSIVGRKFVYGREQWLPWQRLQSLYGWRTLIRAAEMADPLKRFPNTVEALCQQLAKDDQPATPKPTPKQRATPELRQKFADLCLAVRRHQP